MLKLLFIIVGLIHPMVLHAEEAAKPNILSNMAQGFYKRIPNWRELAKQAPLVALVEIGLGDYIESIKNDESAKTFIRDLGMTPGLVINVISNETVAGLPYQYDGYHILGHSAKIASKVGVGYLLSRAGMDPKDAFRYSGHLGDTSARIFIEKSRFTQGHPEEADNFNWAYAAVSAALQIIPNNLIMYQINDLLNVRFGLFRCTKDLTMRAINALPGLPSVDASKTLSENRAAHIPAGGYLKRFFVTLNILFKLEIATAAAKTATTLILSPIGNSIMDAIKTCAIAAHPENLFTGSGEDD